MTNGVDGNDPMQPGEVLAQGRPGSAAAGETVQQHQWRAAALILDIKIDVVDANHAHLTQKLGQVAAAPLPRRPKLTYVERHFGCDRLRVPRLTDRGYGWRDLARTGRRPNSPVEYAMLRRAAPRRQHRDPWVSRRALRMLSRRVALPEEETKRCRRHRC